MNTCPTCGRPECETTLDRITRWCVDNGHHITADGAVYEPVAAAILEHAEGTLRNQRHNGVGVRSHRRGRNGRLLFRLIDLAEEVDKSLTTPDHS